MAIKAAWKIGTGRPLFSNSAEENQDARESALTHRSRKFRTVRRSRSFETQERERASFTPSAPGEAEKGSLVRSRFSCESSTSRRGQSRWNSNRDHRSFIQEKSAVINRTLANVHMLMSKSRTRLHDLDVEEKKGCVDHDSSRTWRSSAYIKILIYSTAAIIFRCPGSFDQTS